MRSISISQIILFFVICFLLFGDLKNLKNKVIGMLQKVKKFFNNKT